MQFNVLSELNCGMSCTSAAYVHENSKRLEVPKIYSTLPPMLSLEDISNQNPIVCSSVLLHRDAIRNFLFSSSPYVYLSSLCGTFEKAHINPTQIRGRLRTVETNHEDYELCSRSRCSRALTKLSGFCNLTFNTTQCSGQFLLCSPCHCNQQQQQQQRDVFDVFLLINITFNAVVTVYTGFT